MWAVAGQTVLLEPGEGKVVEGTDGELGESKSGCWDRPIAATTLLQIGIKHPLHPPYPPKLTSHSFSQVFQHQLPDFKKDLMGGKDCGILYLISASHPGGRKKHWKKSSPDSLLDD